MDTQDVFGELVAFVLENYTRTLVLFDLIQELHPEITKEKLDELIKRRNKTIALDMKFDKWQDSPLFNALIQASESNDL